MRQVIWKTAFIFVTLVSIHAGHFKAFHFRIHFKQIWRLLFGPPVTSRKLAFGKSTQHTAHTRACQANSSVNTFSNPAYLWRIDRSKRGALLVTRRRSQVAPTFAWQLAARFASLRNLPIICASEEKRAVGFCRPGPVWPVSFSSGPTRLENWCPIQQITPPSDSSSAVVEWQSGANRGVRFYNWQNKHERLC